MYEAVTKGYTWILALLDRSLWWNEFLVIKTWVLLIVLMHATSHSLILQSCNITLLMDLACSLLFIKFDAWHTILVLCLILGYLFLGIKMQQFERIVLGKNFSRSAWHRHSYRPLMSKCSFSFFNVIFDLIVVDHWVERVKLSSLHFTFIKIDLIHQI